MLKPWTNEEIEMAADLASRGMTSSEIGKVLNRTRNSVIGKLHRKAIRLGDKKPTRERAAPREKVERRPRNNDFLRSKAPNKKLIERVVEAKESRPIKLFDAKFFECKYIINQDRVAPFNTTCCGATTFNNSSWCKEHYDIVFIPSREKRHGR